MSEDKQKRPWLRTKGESAKAFSYFQRYLRMPPTERSYSKCAAEVGCCQSNIDHMAVRWDWQVRVEAWDRHQDALNFQRFERMRERAAQRRMERELERREKANEVADLLLERARRMLTWPLEEEIVTEETEITADGQHLHITNRIVKPVKWDMIAVTRVVEALDRMQRAMVEDALAKQSAEPVAPGEISERHFTLHTAEQVQMPVVPEQPTEPPKDGDWVVDTGEEGGHGPTEQTVW